MRASLLVVLAATALSLSACGQSEKDPAPVATNAPANNAAPQGAPGDATPAPAAASPSEQDEAKIRHIGDATVNENVGQPMPATFPADVYVPSGYTVVKAMDMGGTMFLISLEVPGTPEEEFAKARQAMAARGWKETALVDDGRSRDVHLEDGTHLLHYSSATDKSSGKTLFFIDYVPLPGAH